MKLSLSSKTIGFFLLIVLVSAIGSGLRYIKLIKSIKKYEPYSKKAYRN